MGILIAKKYPTKLFLKLADHTYVECGTGGKAWSCWGGKTGGTNLRQGVGSTARADKIAQPNEKANIRCYLVNGVCHQAANRILLPAGITVRGARGYSISHAIFGPYGKVGVWPCKSTFNRFPNIGGDIPECIATTKEAMDMEAVPKRRTADDKADWQYIQKVLSIYDEAGKRLKLNSLVPYQAREMQMKLFEMMVDFELGPQVERMQHNRIMRVRENTEMKIEDIQAGLTKEKGDIREYAVQFNRLIEQYQDEMANLLTPEDYHALFDLKPDERIVLADPEIMSREYDVKLEY